MALLLEAARLLGMEGEHQQLIESYRDAEAAPHAGIHRTAHLEVSCDMDHLLPGVVRRDADTRYDRRQPAVLGRLELEESVYRLTIDKGTSKLEQFEVAHGVPAQLRKFFDKPPAVHAYTLGDEPSTSARSAPPLLQFSGKHLCP